ncbi:hypothetical protein PQR66_21475 [Paraburkholderia agricolaris]|uniref:Uncharacterized protein n=1 Tax=Paraburkholderia agricolaris TaxID=2152888 RepID=A0ABW8ZTY3_9BURK
MKIATKGVLTSVLMLGLMSVACAQSANLGVNGANGANGLNGAGGLQAGGANGAGQAMSPGTGVASPNPTRGLSTVGSPPAIGGTGSVGSGPVLNNMRANGTSLNMSPNPRAPNVTGRAFGQ